jgi:hypothetical protein
MVTSRHLGIGSRFSPRSSLGTLAKAGVISLVGRAAEEVSFGSIALLAFRSAMLGDLVETPVQSSMKRLSRSSEVEDCGSQRIHMWVTATEPQKETQAVLLLI